MWFGIAALALIVLYPIPALAGSAEVIVKTAKSLLKASPKAGVAAKPALVPRAPSAGKTSAEVKKAAAEETSFAKSVKSEVDKSNAFEYAKCHLNKHDVPREVKGGVLKECVESEKEKKRK